MKKIVCVFVLTVFAAAAGAFAQAQTGSVGLYEGNNPWPATTGTLAECLKFLDAVLGGKPGTRYGNYYIGVKGAVEMRPLTISGTSPAISPANANVDALYLPHLKSENLVGSGGRLVIKGMGEGASLNSTYAAVNADPAGTGSLFRVMAGANIYLYFENVGLRGITSAAAKAEILGNPPDSVFSSACVAGGGSGNFGNNNQSPLLLIFAGNTLELGDGAEVTGNTNGDSCVAGGGVRVDGEGSLFIMREGSRVAYNRIVSAGWWGGGIFLSTGAEMRMEGGTSAFNKNGQSGMGGGIGVYSGAVCKMSGGVISGNLSHNGGGVVVGFPGSSVGTFTMTGGVIYGDDDHTYGNGSSTDNTETSGNNYGNALWVRNGTVTINGVPLTTNVHTTIDLR
jgi:hypothetical protein